MCTSTSSGPSAHGSSEYCLPCRVRGAVNPFKNIQSFGYSCRLLSSILTIPLSLYSRLLPLSFNSRVRNFKKASSKVVGGYLTSDGDGYDLPFELRPYDAALAGTVYLTCNRRGRDARSQMALPSAKPAHVFDDDVDGDEAFSGSTDPYDIGHPQLLTSTSSSASASASASSSSSSSSPSTSTHVVGRYAPDPDDVVLKTMPIAQWGGEINLTQATSLPRECSLVIALPDLGTLRIPAFFLPPPPLNGAPLFGSSRSFPPSAVSGPADSASGSASAAAGTPGGPVRLPSSPGSGSSNGWVAGGASSSSGAHFYEKVFPLDSPFPGATVRVRWSRSALLPPESDVASPALADMVDAAIRDFARAEAAAAGARTAGTVMGTMSSAGMSVSGASDTQLTLGREASAGSSSVTPSGSRKGQGKRRQGSSSSSSSFSSSSSLSSASAGASALLYLGCGFALAATAHSMISRTPFLGPFMSHVVADPSQQLALFIVVVTLLFTVAVRINSRGSSRLGAASAALRGDDGVADDVDGSEDEEDVDSASGPNHASGSGPSSLPALLGTKAGSLIGTVSGSSSRGSALQAASRAPLWTLTVFAPQAEDGGDLSRVRFGAEEKVRLVSKDSLAVAQLVQGIRHAAEAADAEGIALETSHGEAKHSVGIDFQTTPGGGISRPASRAGSSSSSSSSSASSSSGSFSGGMSPPPLSTSSSTSSGRFSVSPVHPFVGGLLEFEDIEPQLFRRIRKAHGVSTPDYVQSWTFALAETPSLTLGAGRSGSLFLHSADRRFLFKTITKDDLTTLMMGTLRWQARLLS